MKKTIAIATFVALGAGTVSAGALSDISFKGSDTLFALTQDVIAACPGATGLTYLGGGSGPGETAIIASTAQTIAPMSRFLANSAAVCASTFVGSAEGFAVAADGLSIFVAGVHRATCDPASAAEDCNRLTDPQNGLAYNTVIPVGAGTYTLTDWRDALRIIYHGVENTDGPFPIADARTDVENAPVTTPPAPRIRDCNSPVRQALVANWSRVFQNACDGAAASCGPLQHAFRRDQNSGTTDVLRELIQSNTSARTENRGFPFCNEVLDGGEATTPSCPPSGLAPSSTYCAVDADCGAGVTCNIVGGVGMCNPTSCTVDADCSAAFNARLAADPVPPNGASFPGCGAAGQPPCPVCRGSLCVPNLPGSPGSPTPPFFEAFQDRDPVRRACLASPAAACNLPVVGGGPLTAGACEQVCGARGDLGLVLPIAVPPSVAPADAYPVTACQNNRFELGQAPVIAVGLQARNGLCPNGDMPRGGRWEPMSQAVVGGVGCLVPVSPAGDRRCMNGKNSRPLPQNPPPGFTGAQCAQLPGVTAFDGRVYNLHPHLANGNYLTQTYTFLGTASPRQQVGAFYRMHTTRTAIAADPNCPGDNCCQQADSTRQISCLVQANPCSVGFAGREGATVSLVTTTGAKSAYSSSVDAVSPVLDSCIVGGQYRLGRNLWMNTMIGIGAVNGDELGLMSCYLGTGTTTPITTLVTARDFVPITPFCNDYNSALCNPVIPNAGDACGDNPAGFPNADNPLVP